MKQEINMTEVLQQFPSPSSCSCAHDAPPVLINNTTPTTVEIQQQQQQQEERDREGDQIPILTLLIATFRKSLIGCSNTNTADFSSSSSMEIGWPSNVRHVAHVTFDRFHGFLGLPVEFEPELPRRPPSARYTTLHASHYHTFILIIFFILHVISFHSNSWFL